MFRNGLSCLLVAGAFAAGPALAEMPVVRPGLFGTLGLSWHGEEHLEYRRDQNQRNGTRGGSLDSGLDSLLGVQLNLSLLEDRLGGVVQAVSRQDVNGGWSPGITWAFARIEPLDNLQIRFGRLGLDTTTLGSDSRLIGYALRTVRPAPELYAGVALDSIDGADLVYLTPAGDDLLRFKAFGGRAKLEVSQQGRTVHFPDARTMGAQLTYIGERVQLRFTRGYAKVSGAGDIQPLVDALAAIPLPQTVRAAERLDLDGVRVSYSAVDAYYDDGPLRAQANILRFDMPNDHPGLASQWLGRLLFSYRLGDFSPYVSLSGVRTSQRDTRSGLEGLPGLEALDAAARATIDGATINQRALTVGVRYDLRPGLALKFQVDRVHAGRSPVVTDLDDPDSTRRRLTLFSFALDFAY